MIRHTSCESTILLPEYMPLSHFAVLVVFVAAQGALAQSAPRGVAAARAYRTAHEAEILADFAKLLAIPNVSSDSANIRENARYISDKLRGAGVRSELWEMPGV